MQTETQRGQQGTIIISDNIITSINRNASGSEFGEGIDINQYAENVTAIITGNEIKGFREQGIDCNVGKCIITNNNIEMEETETRQSMGIAAYMSAKPRNGTTGTISNNVITKVTQYGVYVDAAKDFHIIGNTIVGTGKNNRNSIGIWASGTGIQIIANSIRDINTSIRPSGTTANDLIMIGNSHNN